MPFGRTNTTAKVTIPLPFIFAIYAKRWEKQREIQNISGRYGGLAIKLKSKANSHSGYGRFTRKIFLQAVGMAVLAFALIAVVYILVWRGNGGELLIALFQRIWNLEY